MMAWYVNVRVGEKTVSIETLTKQGLRGMTLAVLFKEFFKFIKSTEIWFEVREKILKSA